MKKTALVILLLALAAAVHADSGIRRVPCGYQQVSIDSATMLTVPTTCGGPPTMVLITPEAQAVRYRDDGTAPTATVGMPLAVGAALEYEGDINAIEFISQTSGAKVNALFYR